MLEEIRCGHCNILHKPNNESEMLGRDIKPFPSKRSSIRGGGGGELCVPPRDGAPQAILMKSRH